MSQSLANILVHLVFSTKDRDPLLRDEWRRDLHSYMAGVFKGIESPALTINSMPDHLHALFSLSKKLALSGAVEEVKTATSKWIKKRDAQLSGFHWQNGYGAFSVSQSQVDVVREYIDNQREHHRVTGFQDEFRAFCRRHELPHDERYAWD